MGTSEKNRGKQGMNNKKKQEEQEEEEHSSSEESESASGSSSVQHSDDDDEKEEGERRAQESDGSSSGSSSSDDDNEEEEEKKAEDGKETTKNAEDGALKQQPAQAKSADSSDNNNESNNGGIMTSRTFESLGLTCRPLLEACRERLQWKTATAIQEAVLPEALRGNDIIGLAETGSGKTGAFALPILQRMLEQSCKSKSVALILTPTRELAFQIHEVVRGLATGMGATSVAVVGGVDRTSQAIALARFPHVIIATPGRLLDHLKDTKGFHLRHIRFLVLDEADRMLSLDFEEELHQILDNLSANEETRQTMLFSATMTSQVQKLQRASLNKNAVKVQVSTKFQTPSQLQQSYLFIPAKYKDCYLTYLVNEHAGQSILVFAATCNNVQRLALMLRNLGFPAVCLHGQMPQNRRLGMLHKFASGDRSILISTDVASRGLDLPAVDLVINFDLPSHGKE